VEAAPRTADNPPEYRVIHTPPPWPYGGASRTRIVALGSPPPPGTMWQVLFEGSGYACTVFVEQRDLP
jgi:hypothetical protein